MPCVATALGARGQGARVPSPPGLGPQAAEASPGPAGAGGAAPGSGPPEGSPQGGGAPTRERARPASRREAQRRRRRRRRSALRGPAPRQLRPRACRLPLRPPRGRPAATPVYGKGTGGRASCTSRSLFTNHQASEVATAGGEASAAPPSGVRPQSGHGGTAGREGVRPPRAGPATFRSFGKCP